MTENEEISDRERQKLLNRLHRSLFWVGKQIPRKIKLNEKEIDLHEVIWEIVNRPKLEKDDLRDIELFMGMLIDKEKEYEKQLENEQLSPDDAKKVFDLAAGVRRAIMDLKELTTPSKRKAIFKDRHICKDVETDKWDSLTDELKKKGC
ncbi:DUF5788 family protein [Methanolobus sp. WCC5]|uniref:DUF5788 family protein n=1 Tax=Methanolobus sp. WCC5 TaxID=3125785 RepID=UPI0032523406